MYAAAESVPCTQVAVCWMRSVPRRTRIRTRRCCAPQIGALLLVVEVDVTPHSRRSVIKRRGHYSLLGFDMALLCRTRCCRGPAQAADVARVVSTISNRCSCRWCHAQRDHTSSEVSAANREPLRQRFNVLALLLSESTGAALCCASCCCHCCCGNPARMLSRCCRTVLHAVVVVLHTTAASECVRRCCANVHSSPQRLLLRCHSCCYVAAAFAAAAAEAIASAASLLLLPLLLLLRLL